MNKDKIEAICREGICPLCGSEFTYGCFDLEDNGGTYNWECSHCGASGKEGYDMAFDGNHYDVKNGDGEPVEIVSPSHKVPADAESVDVVPVCLESGRCPLCGGELDYGDADEQDGGCVISWTCCACGATGEEGREEVFNGEHYDVRDCNGNSITLVTPGNDVRTSSPMEGCCPKCGSEYRVASADDTYEDEKMFWVCDHCGSVGTALYHTERTFDGFEDVMDADGSPMALDDDYAGCAVQDTNTSGVSQECNQSGECTPNGTESSRPQETGEDFALSSNMILDLIDAHRSDDTIKTNDDDEILVKGSASKVKAIAEFLECLGFKAITGYYDPKDDKEFGGFDAYTGYRYIRITNQ